MTSDTSYTRIGNRLTYMFGPGRPILSILSRLIVERCVHDGPVFKSTE